MGIASMGKFSEQEGNVQEVGCPGVNPGISLSLKIYCYFIYVCM